MKNNLENIAIKPKPTKQLMVELCGGNQGLIQSVHHGLYESSLRDFYPVLDLDETIAFAAGSWKQRDKNPCLFPVLMESKSTYSLFNEMFKIGFPWLNKYKNISKNLKLKYEKLNPFNGKDLKTRLSNVDEVSIEKLRIMLKQKTCEYVFDCQYHSRKAARGGDNSGLVPMSFQNVYPKHGKIVPAYASEIVRIFGNYPTEYDSKLISEKKKKEEKPKIFYQEALFD